MAKKSKEWVYGYEQDLIAKDSERDEMLEYIEGMARIDWDFPPEFKQARPDVRTIRDSTPAEAVENASIAMSNNRPIWTVAPYSSNLAEYQRTEKLEEVIRCGFKKSNVRGVGTVLYDKARSSILYNMNATRTDDLAYILPKKRSTWTNLQREAWGRGRFIHRVYKPKTVHVDTSDMGLIALCQVQLYRVGDVMKYWELFADESDEGKRVQHGLNQMKDFVNRQMVTQKMTFRAATQMWFAQYYFINHDQVLVHGHFAPNGTDIDENVDPQQMDDIVFADHENDAGFINWSVRMGGSRIEDDPKYQLNPMLASLYYSNAWETVNIIQSIVLSKPIAELERANEIQYTRDGQRLPENDGVIVANVGERVERPPYPQMDPQTMQVLDRLQSSIIRNTGASQLSDINAAKGSAFASLNAILQIIMGRLDVQRRDISLSLADDAINALKWVEYTKVPWTAYRDADVETAKAGSALRGDMIAITADDFDPYEIDIACEIKPKTPTDFQQQVLTAIQLHDKTPLPWSELLENLGFENTELLKQQRIMEDFDDAEVQAALKNIMMQEEAKGQMKIQQMQQAQQQAQQPPQPDPMAGGGGQPMTGLPKPGGGISETAFGGLGGMQGFNPAMGGTPPSTMQPQLTREMVSGMTKSGQSIGG